MAVPVLPIAIAAGTVYLARNLRVVSQDQLVDDYMDDLPDGFSGSSCKDASQVNLAGRYKRTLRLGKKGPGFEIDAIGFSRLRFNRVGRV